MSQKMEGFFTVLVTPDIRTSVAFYERHFGFAPVFDSGWYVHLRHPDEPKWQLGIVEECHDSLPRGHRGVSHNVLLSFEVPDATAEFERLKKLGSPVALELTDEAWGQRHFMLTDPHGTVIDVIQWIEPSAEFAEKYLSTPAG
jgi:catechol 2,3-dioxygenase-like lactoylglutathione lyase family enzyme